MNESADDDGRSDGDGGVGGGSECCEVVIMVNETNYKDYIHNVPARITASLNIRHVIHAACVMYITMK